MGNPYVQENRADDQNGDPTAFELSWEAKKSELQSPGDPVEAGQSRRIPSTGTELEFQRVWRLSGSPALSKISKIVLSASWQDLLREL